MSCHSYSAVLYSTFSVFGLWEIAISAPLKYSFIKNLYWLFSLRQSIPFLWIVGSFRLEKSSESHLVQPPAQSGSTLISHQVTQGFIQSILETPKNSDSTATLATCSSAQFSSPLGTTPVRFRTTASCSSTTHLSREPCLVFSTSPDVRKAAVRPSLCQTKSKP